MIQPNPEQLNAIRLFAEANGRCWKQALRELWMNGAYNNAVLGGADPAMLQQLRNSFGPSWLVRFKNWFGLESLDLSNGEAAMLAGLRDFIDFLHEQGLPLPSDLFEMETTFVLYIKAWRAEQMRRVSAGRVARGESPLPAELLKRD